jgi:tetratricopeptide (TPR) repeat protein
MTAFNICTYRHLTFLAVGLLTGWAAAADDAPSGSATPRPWSLEVATALETYRAGDFAGAQRLATQAAARSRDSNVRRDAAVIETLCMLRSPARADRTEGRTRLRQLAGDDATLLDEPECNLAYGIAETELGETGEALDALDRAAAGFAEQKLPARQGAALVALADAWARHGDWEATPPRFGAPRHQDATEADAIRRGHIEELRARVAELPDHEGPLAELDLVLAKHLVAAGDPAGEGLGIFERLAAAPKLTDATANATLLLAQQYESNARWADALRLYQRLAKEWPGAIAREAADHAEQITRPQIAIDVPNWVPCGQAVRAHVRVRGLDAVQVEARQVDVDAWLATARSRVSDAFLPASGSVRLARDLVTRGSVEYGWWDSDKLETPLEFAAEPGAYVLLVLGTDAGGRAQVAKRLIVVSDLRAACIVGSQHVVVWATREGEGREGEAPTEPFRLTGKFWMNRSFVPTEIAFDGTVARFELPAEARVMRDRGWVCLVRSGEQIAVCRGSLPHADAGQSVPQVALLASPPAPAVGETLWISGLVVPSLPFGARITPASPIELQVMDTLEEVQSSVTLEPTAGALAMQVPVTPDLAGKHLRVLARQDGRSMENVLGRAGVSVPPTEGPDFRVRLDVPAWLAPEATELTGRVRAEYAWGTGPARLRARLMFRAMQLPAADEAPTQVTGTELAARLDDNGQTTFALPLGELGPTGRPLAIHVEAHVQSWDSREGAAQAEVLVGPQHPYTWLLCTPARPMVGQEVRFHAGWLEPNGLALAEAPTVVLRHDGREVVRLALHPSREGWTSPGWRFVQSGTYEATTTLTLRAAESPVVSRSIEVGPASATSPTALPVVHCQAQCVGTAQRAAVQVELDGQSAEPLLALVEDGDVQAAQDVPALSGQASVLLPLEAGVSSALRVAVLRGSGELKSLCTGEVAPAALPGFEVKATAPEQDPWPGSVVSVPVSGAWPVGTALVARLINAVDAGFTDSGADSPGRAAERSAPTLAAVSSAHGPVNWGGVSREAADKALGSELRAAFAEGITLWSTSLAATEPSLDLEVPIPAQPGLYKLIVAARAPTGQVASDTLMLDARRGVRLEVNAPEWLTVGDRSLVAVRVENAYAEPLQAQVRCEVGAGLHAEGIAERTNLEPVTMDLAARASGWLYVDVEATRVGAGCVTANVSARGEDRSARCTYAVRRSSDSEPAATVKLKRSLVVWTAPSEADDAAAARATLDTRASPGGGRGVHSSGAAARADLGPAGAGDVPLIPRPGPADAADRCASARPGRRDGLQSPCPGSRAAPPPVFPERGAPGVGGDAAAGAALRRCQAPDRR